MPSKPRWKAYSLATISSMISKASKDVEIRKKRMAMFQTLIRRDRQSPTRSES